MNRWITADANLCTLDSDELLIKCLAPLALGGAISTLTAVTVSLNWFLSSWMQNCHWFAWIRPSAPDYYDKYICVVCVITMYTLSCIMRSTFVFLNNYSHYWDAESGDNDCFKGKGHTNQVTKMAINDSGELVTCSMDDTLRFTNLRKKEYR